MSLAAEVAYGLSVLIATQGGMCVYTSVTTIPQNANPAPNPPTIMAPIVAAPALSGATSINFSAAILTGRLVAGDSFMVPGDDTEYVVDAPVISPVTAPTLTGVTFSPPLLEDVAQGTVPIFAFQAAFPLMALITDFPAFLVNGGSIQQKDHKVRFLIDGVLPGDVPSSYPAGITPNIGDTVDLPDGQTYKVIRTSHLEVQGVHYGYSMQVRA
jgi:hypothetical protein